MPLRMMFLAFVGAFPSCWSLQYTIPVVVLALFGAYIARDWFYSIKQEVAPWWNKYDSWFASGVLGLLILGYATFVSSACPVGLWMAFQRFVNHSGLLALLTGFTAIIALYRLRHRPDKTRPSVREDFKNYDGERSTDFGLRNFGPGPALYLQAAVEVVNDEVDTDDSKFGPKPCLEVHEHPIHLQEGEFASLVPEGEDSWVQKVAEEFEIDAEENNNDGPDDSLKVNLHYTYITQSGAREPTDVTAKRDDTRLVERDDLIDRDDEPRQIELWRVIKAMDIGSAS